MDTRAPRIARLVAYFTAISSFRAVLGPLLATRALTGSYPLVFVIGGCGDALAGALAPLVAWRLLRRPNLTTWLLACMWQLYSACDFLFANAAHLIATRGMMPAADGTLRPVGIGFALFVALFVALHFASIVLLQRDAVRRHYAAGRAAPP